MKSVLTVIGNPSERPLDRSIAERARAALVAGDGQPGPVDWLARKIAFDIPFEGPPALAAVVGTALAGLELDIVGQASAGRRRALLVADMDSTIITVECIDELADVVGLRAEISAVTERAMRGELDFQTALNERVARLRGIPVTTLREVFEERVRLSPGARTLVATMRRNGARCVLVSGGFTYFTERVRELAGFDEDRANRLVIEDDRLTGAVARPILGRDAKRQALEDVARSLNIPLAETLAVGDGANDLDMIRIAGLGVAYHAKPVVADAAPARIDHGDLTALLYLQGYRVADFVDP